MLRKVLPVFLLLLFLSAVTVTSQSEVTPVPPAPVIQTDEVILPVPALEGPGDIAYVGDFLSFKLTDSDVGDWSILITPGSWYDTYRGKNPDNSYTTILVPRTEGIYHVVVAVTYDGNPKMLSQSVQVLDAKAKPGPDDDKKKDDDKKDDGKKDDEKKPDPPVGIVSWIVNNKALIMESQATFTQEVEAVEGVFTRIIATDFRSYRDMASTLSRDVKEALVNVDKGTSSRASADARWGAFMAGLGKQIDEQLGADNQDIASRKKVFADCVEGFKSLKTNP